MTGFLERLAGMATGDPAPGSAVADLPPRFGWGFTPLKGHADRIPAGPAPAGLAPADPDAVDPRPVAPGSTESMPRPNAAAARAPHAGNPAGESTASAGHDRRANPRRADSPPLQSPAPRGPERKGRPREVSAPPGGQPAPHPVMHAAPPSDRHRPRSAGDPAPHSKAATAPAPPSSAPVTTQGRAAPSAPMRPAQGPQAPLSDAALAGRAARPREPTVVHVTIDRLDVRAPAEPRPAPGSPRRRPQPSVSLSDYLGGAPGAGRGRP